MFDSQLFLGLPLSESFQDQLQQVSDFVRNSFIQPIPSPYLQQIEFDGKVYLGKQLGSLVELASIEATQLNILSLIKKVVPHHHYKKTEFVMFVLPT